MGLPKYLVLIFIGMFLFAGLVSGATLRGNVYNSSLDKISNVVIVVDSDPVQRFVVKDGTYEFSLPPGSYTLSARTFLEENVLGADVDITIRNEGTFVSDLVLEEINESHVGNGVNDNLDNNDSEWGFDLKKVLQFTDLILVAFFVLVVFFLVWKFVLSKRFSRKESGDKINVKVIGGNSNDKGNYDASSDDASFGYVYSADTSSDDTSSDGASYADVSSSSSSSTTTASSFGENESGEKKIFSESSAEDDLDEYGLKLLNIVREERRITQKELRQKFDLSESKISLIITELQNKNYVRRVKQGRGNVIILNKGVKSGDGSKDSVGKKSLSDD